MYCKNCGKPIADNAVYCEDCGVKQHHNNDECCPNCGVNRVPGAAVCPNCGISFVSKKTGTAPKSKILAGVLGLVFGPLGVHNFYLGYTKKAIVQVVLSTIGGFCTCGIATIVVAVWAFVESVMILCGSIDTDGYGNHLTE